MDAKSFEKAIRQQFDVVLGIYKNLNLPNEILERQRNLFEYNVIGGKMTRGMTVLKVCAALLGEQMKKEDLVDATVLGVAIEFLQAAFLVADDVMDEGVTRRGKPCWYRQNNTGLAAMNDAWLLESAVYQVLRHFSTRPALYQNMMDVFHEITFLTEVGEMLDLTYAPTAGATIHPSDFTMEKYEQMVRYKTSYYSFYAPVYLAVTLVGKTMQECFRSVLLDLGQYFQVQDDYLDCYGSAKVGTDIEEAKVTWLAVKAMELCDDADRQLFCHEYGKNGHPEAIRTLYEKLKLPAHYAEFEAAQYSALMAKIAALPQDGEHSIPKEVFTSLLQKIYRRTE